MKKALIGTLMCLAAGVVAYTPASANPLGSTAGKVHVDQSGLMEQVGSRRGKHHGSHRNKKVQIYLGGGRSHHKKRRHNRH